MLWSDDVLNKADRAAKRLWLTGTIAAGMLSEDQLGWDDVPFEAVTMADKILEELAKDKTK
jgi:hypothetical protein